MVDQNLGFINIAYLGQDELYFHKLVTQFKKAYPNIKINYFIREVKSNLNAFKLMTELVTLDLDIIYIDYSLYSESYLKLAKFLKNQSTTRDLPLIGLSGINNTNEEFHKGLIAGCNVIYNKSIEVTDAVFHGMKLAYPEKAKIQKVALVDQINFPLKSYHFFRVGFVTSEYIHVECNLKLEIGEEVTLSGGIIDQLKSYNFKVLRKIEENFYYNFNFSYDLKFIKPTLENEETLEEKEKIKKVELKEKEERQNWIKNMKEKSVDKKIKVLFFDYEMELLKETENEIDNFPFSLRIHQFMDKKGVVINEVMPSIVVFCKRKNGKEKDGFLLNNQSAFKKLVDLIEKKKDFSPFIIIFNEKEDTEVLKQDLNYERILPIPKDFSLKLALDIIKSFQENKGLVLTHNPSSNIKQKEIKYYISKSDPLSIVKSEHSIEVHSMSETFFTLSAPTCLLEGTVIKIETPFEVGLTLALTENNEFYTALVNGISSKNMAELRQLINTLIKDKNESDIEEAS